jgi:intein/homing endonuclease
MPRFILGDAVGLGKAQPLTAKILTPTGWTTMGEIKVGDAVVDPDGGIGYVEGVYPQGEKEIFRLRTNDSCQTECCEEHLWTVQTVDDRIKGKFRTLTTKQLLEKGLFEINGPEGWHRNRFFLPSIKPSSFQARSSLSIKSYTMGALLGDGTFRHHMAFSVAEREILERVEKELPSTLNLKHVGDHDYNIITPTRKNNAYINAMRKLGLFGHFSYEKFIPECYLKSSISNRIELLRGIMDTDGECGKSYGAYFSSTSFHLANDVADLVRSLGGIAKIKYGGKGKYKKKDGTIKICRGSWNVSIKTSFVPFHLTRKVQIWKPPIFARAILDISSVGVKSAQCIRVSTKRNLYITDDYIPTHNTLDCIAAAAYLKGRFPNIKIIVLATKSTTLQWASEFERFSTLRPYVMQDTFGKKSSYPARFDQLHTFFHSKKIDVMICKYSSMIGKRKKIEGRFDSEGNPVKQGRERIASEVREFCKIIKPYKENVILILDECQKFKAQPLTSKVLTPEGWKFMGELQLGDKVVDPDGGWGKVSELHPIHEAEVFQLTTDDGCKAQAADKHLWLVTDENNRQRNTDRILTTQNLITEIVRRKILKRPLSIPVTKPVNFTPKRKRLPISPYVLGVLLGDGSIAYDGVGFTNEDLEIVEHCKTLLPASLKIIQDNYDLIFWRVVQKKVHFGKTLVRWAGRKDGSKKPSWRTHEYAYWLRRFGLRGKRAHEKYIPLDYLRASIPQRIELLRGLLDTDGSISDTGQIILNTTSKALAENTLELVRSLGGVARIHGPYEGSYTKNERKITTRNFWRISLFTPINPFRLSRKAEKWEKQRKLKRSSQMSARAKRIVTIDTLGRNLVRCITVTTKRGLYITDDYLVTHNSVGGSHRYLVQALQKQCGWVWALTATVIKNDLSEFYSIASAIGIRPFGYMRDFEEEFCIFYDQYIGGGRSIKTLKGYQNVAKFKAGIRPFFYGRSQAQVKEPLPKLTTIYHRVDLNDEQAKLLLTDIPQGKFVLPPTFVEHNGEMYLRERDVNNNMTMLSVYQLVANHPGLLDRSNIKDFYSKKLSPKEECLLDMLDGDYRGEKIIVYTKYRSWIDRLEKITKDGHFTDRKFLRITGNENEQERHEAKLKFQDPNSGYDLIVINAAGMEGINLQQAAHMILLDAPWSWGDLIQLVGRMIRMASPHSACTLHVLTAKGTIDEYTIETLKGKKGVFESILGESHSAGILDDGLGYDIASGMEAVGTEEEFKSMLTAHIKSVGMSDFLEGELLIQAREDDQYKMVFEKGGRKRKEKVSDKDLLDRWGI